MKISVSLCTYNGERFIHEQLDSIINQGINVDEIIICDDCSTDNTINILELFAKQYPYLIKLFINIERVGTLKNFENCISFTNGDLIFLSDQDDIWVKDKVKKTVDFFKKKRTCKLLFSNGTIIDEKGKYQDSTLWEKWEFDKNVQRKWMNNKKALEDLIINKNKITGATVCFHKSLKKNILPIRIPLGYWHDAWFGMHAAAQEGLYFFDEKLINYRVHLNNQVGLSSNINSYITLNSNPNPIGKNIFINNFCCTYPNLELNINNEDKTKTFLKRLKLKILNSIKEVFFKYKF